MFKSIFMGFVALMISFTVAQAQDGGFNEIALQNCVVLSQHFNSLTDANKVSYQSADYYYISKVNFVIPPGESNCYANYRFSYEHTDIVTKGDQLNCVAGDVQVFCSGIITQNQDAGFLTLGDGYVFLPSPVREEYNSLTFIWLFYGRPIFLPKVIDV